MVDATNFPYTTQKNSNPATFCMPQHGTSTALNPSQPMCDPVGQPAQKSAPDRLLSASRLTDNGSHPWIQLFSPAKFTWTRAELPINGLPASLDGLRLIHLTDLHFTRHWYPAHDELLRHIAQSDADLIVITGDLVDYKPDYRRGVSCVRRLFDGLKSRYGTYTILGNHDGHLMAQYLSHMPTRLIDGTTVLVNINDASIELIGLPGVDRSELEPDFFRNLSKKQPGIPRIVLSHYPDHIRKIAQLEPDLVLAGHTHGGQVRLPMIGPIFTHDRLPRKYVSGIHRYGESWLVVGRGMGFSWLPIRLFCPAQTIEIILRAA